jgi:hypothetical protein
MIRLLAYSKKKFLMEDTMRQHLCTHLPRYVPYDPEFLTRVRLVVEKKLLLSLSVSLFREDAHFPSGSCFPCILVLQLHEQGRTSYTNHQMRRVQHKHALTHARTSNALVANFGWLSLVSATTVQLVDKTATLMEYLFSFRERIDCGRATEYS